MNQPLQATFRVHIGDTPRTITQRELQEYADMIRLSDTAPGRFSWLFALNVYLHQELTGIDPSTVVDEIRRLESGSPGAGTKPATQFSREPLRGLWHKHFFSAHFVGQNIANHFAGGKLEQLAEEVLDPSKSPVLTRDMISEFTSRFTEGALEARHAAGKLTGEWIVFAKHKGANYYLCISSHTSGDQAIFDQIQTVCAPQFAFLANRDPKTP